MKKLFFDVAITGHHVEYISHIINYLSTEENQNQYYFVLHPEFSKKFVALSEKMHKTKNLELREISQQEFIKATTGNMITTSLRQYKLMDKYARLLKVQHVCALNFHPIKYGGIFYRSTYTLSGILFLQFYRLSKNSIKDKLEYIKRYFLTKLYTLNSKIRYVYVLNDNEAVNYMNKEFKTNVFKMLPDPIPELTPLPDFDIYRQYNLCKEKKIFLHIGSLGDRKGTFEVIKAASKIPKSYQNKTSILLVGKAGNEEKAILKSIENHKNESDVELIWDNQFISENMMKSLFNQCYGVLLPYKNAEFSSGILGHAAAANKMVIATGRGLIKEIVQENNLGFLLENPTPDEICNKIIESIDSNFNPERAASFVQNHSPKTFSRLLCNS